MNGIISKVPTTQRLRPRSSTSRGRTKASVGQIFSAPPRLSPSKSAVTRHQDSLAQVALKPGRTKAPVRKICIAPQKPSPSKSAVTRHQDALVQVALKPDKYHSEGIFDQTGGELHIPSYGLTLFIPAGALQEGSSETITIDVLKDIQPEIPLRHNETLVTYGFQCLPSGLQFVSERPVKLKIPHCANLIDPTKVQVVLYSINHEGKGVRIVQTSRTCQVTNNHVEILLKHFSQGCVAFIKDSHFYKYKQMSFMPFIPKIMGSSRKIALEFRMVNKPHGISWKNVHEIGDEADYRAAKDDDDEMNVKFQHMEITCQLEEDDTLTENIHESFLDKTKHTVYFVLDFHGKADDLPVKLKVIQSKVPMGITFITRFLPSPETNLPSGKQGDSSNSVRLDAANSSSVTGNTFIGQLNHTNCSGLGGSPRNKRKKTNQKTDSNDKDKGTKEDKQTKRHGYKTDGVN